MNICLIPARGGSKRIPRKNIRDFCGKPMISWSILAAQESACFDQIIVSTEDEEITKLARQLGADTPFQRPHHLSDDLTTTSTVVRHAISWLQDRGQQITAVCCLYATAPLVQAQDIKYGLNLLSNVAHNRFVFAGTTYPFPIQRAVRIDPSSGLTSMWNPEYYQVRSQDLEPAFHDAGQFYWGRPKAWLETENLFSCAKMVELPSWRVQDIDTEEDWIKAELLFKVANLRPKKVN